MIHPPGFHAWYARIHPHFEQARGELIAELTALRLDARFAAENYAKNRRGWIEHGGGITRMTDAELALEERDEILDLLSYRSTRIACSTPGAETGVTPTRHPGADSLAR